MKREGVKSDMSKNFDSDIERNFCGLVPDEPAPTPEVAVESATVSESEICDVCGRVLEYPPEDDPRFLGDSWVTSLCRHCVRVRNVNISPMHLPEPVAESVKTSPHHRFNTIRNHREVPSPMHVHGRDEEIESLKELLANTPPATKEQLMQQRDYQIANPYKPGPSQAFPLRPFPKRVHGREEGQLDPNLLLQCAIDYWDSEDRMEGWRNVVLRTHGPALKLPTLYLPTVNALVNWMKICARLRRGNEKSTGRRIC